MLPYSNAELMKIYNHAQVPTGTDKPVLTWPSGDVGVDTYKAIGSAVYNSGPYTSSQQVIIDSSQITLEGRPIATFTLEEL